MIDVHTCIQAVAPTPHAHPLVTDQTTPTPPQPTHPNGKQAFTRVVQQEPDEARAWGNIAAVQMRLGDYERALAVCGAVFVFGLVV